MKIATRAVLIALVHLCLVVAVFAAEPQSAQPGAAAPAAAGQTVTLLPGGSWLLVGGQDSTGHPVATISVRDAGGNEKQLGASLRFARAWHTATVLPDGSVLILGGIGSDGLVVQAAELFHPETRSLDLLPSAELPQRVFHSSTLLTESQALIVGGVSPSGEVLKTIELVDSRTKSKIVLPAELASARRNHTATLLPDGRVLLWGGKDAFGQPLNYGEIYDPATQSLMLQTMPLISAADGASPFLAASIPEDGATGVAVDSLLALRFSKAMQVETVNAQSVSLQDPNGLAVAAKVVAAEGGMLGFVTPQALLAPATRYTLTLTGLTDTQGNSLPDKSISFTTANSDDDTWVPGSLGDWQTGWPNSPWQALPPLQAPPGVTAIAGQVLTLQGKPIPNVTFRVGKQSARSDGTGRFLVTNVSSGHAVLFMDGRTASTANKTYGTFEAGVDVKGGQTNVLNYTIWFPLIDTQHEVTIPSPTTSEVVVTTPYIPGLELHIPPNTVIVDYDGNVVHHVGITPIPVARPPFPLPANVYVPIYFTAQPGGAYIKNYSPGGPQGARVIYPNYRHLPPGARGTFWHYDPDSRGWYIYGMGTVTPNGKQVMPDPGVMIYEFTGAMFNSTQTPPGSGPNGASGASGAGGEPVDLGTGLFVYNKTDLALRDLIPISLSRTYRQGDNNPHPFGIGATHPYDLYVWNPTSPQYQEVDLVLPDGSRIHYSRISPGTGYTDAAFQNTTSNGAFYNSQIAWNGNGWNLTLKDGTVYVFGADNPLQAIRDRYGNQLTIAHASGQSGNITQITSPNGRWITFQYDGINRITQATDNLGRTVLYSYDTSGRLAQVTDANGGIWQYGYDASNNMTSITDARNINYLQNFYDANGRVYKQIQADGSTYQFSYTVNSVTSTISQTNVTDPNGHVRSVTFGTPQIFPDGFQTGGMITSETRALGLPEQETLTYNYGGAGVNNPANFLQSLTDALGRTTSFTYDGMGNTTSVTRLAGTAQAVTTSFTYDPAFNQLASVTDPLGNKTSFSYDTKGNPAAIVDPLGDQSTFGYNSLGQLTSTKDPLGNTAQFGYSGADLTSVTDPLGNSTTALFDAVGRMISFSDPQGHTAKFQYNNLNLLTQITDSLGNATNFSYDPNGNLLSLSDALTHGTRWTYDNMDRVFTRTDPLQRHAGFSYDLSGNLASTTDRKGQVTTFQYDGLNRLTFAGFGTQGSGSGTTYASTVSYTYDGGNRLTQAADSIAGTITEGYDNLDRLTSETTPQGSVAYGYDSAGRRTSMQVAGQPAVSYTWDNASRLTQISQGSSNVSLSYDSGGRRASLTLPNNVVVSYSYDADSRLTGISYQFGTNILGNLSYSYDQLGRRTQAGGSFARTGLPAAVASATYDAANELTNWNGTSISYDANGNMLSDGTHTFTWDARNQVASINGVNLQYDAFGRRIQNLLGTSFLYDGLNAVQELSGTTVTANLLNGAIDEIFSRTDSSGSFAQLRDLLGSTLALTDANGSLQTTYSYDPFGKTSSAGPASTNVFQYTGREDEGNGLYYYRARYYNPLLGRFISQDPLGFAGGSLNLYAYAANSPANFTDPGGKNVGVLAPALIELGPVGWTILAVGTVAVLTEPLWAPTVQHWLDDADSTAVPNTDAASQSMAGRYSGGGEVVTTITRNLAMMTMTLTTRRLNTQRKQIYLMRTTMWRRSI